VAAAAAEAAVAAEAAEAAEAALALAAEAALALAAEAAELAAELAWELAVELPAEAAARRGELAAGARADRLPIVLTNAGLYVRVRQKRASRSLGPGARADIMTGKRGTNSARHASKDFPQFDSNFTAYVRRPTSYASIPTTGSSFFTANSSGSTMKVASSRSGCGLITGASFANLERRDDRRHLHRSWSSHGPRSGTRDRFRY
jgi:hypothetical protein